MKTVIGYEIHLSNGDGSVQAKKFKTLEAAQRYLEVEESQEWYESLCDAGPNAVHLEDFEDSKHEDDPEA